MPDVTQCAIEAAKRDPRVFPLSGPMARYTARLGTINSESVQRDGTVKWFDTLNVENEDGEVVDAMTVESSEDPDGYRWALAENGWLVVGDTMTGSWRVRRATERDR